jgi:uncharacterized membrane protein YeiH
VSWTTLGTVIAQTLIVISLLTVLLFILSAVIYAVISGIRRDRATAQTPTILREERACTCTFCTHCKAERTLIEEGITTHTTASGMSVVTHARPDHDNDNDNGDEASRTRCA